ncbi:MULTISPECIES: SurA N-terminal domain-containing protein [Streptomyces]|uniref:SurA N-terminal domain-containing protein n=1 Tax=Streptomyces TaxID=1883 RepID=UPI001424B5B5|nr:SurA N-terminal domain-containing protein [Streptomyces sp. AgN23]AJZ85976.1 SurA N-terminal domain-containing protein [Streptomyces sp. AgN23]WTA82114.1 SurA N-terminal domain-containing protein [Streptomyces antimycoticus]
MIRRHTALSVSAASALLLSAPLLTACGEAPRPGAAAVMDGGRITVSELQGQVKAVREAQRNDPRATQMVAGSGRLSQDTLIRMIQFRVIERAGKDNGISLTRREIQRARSTAETQSGGATALRALYLQQGIAPAGIDEAVRMDLTRNALLRKLGTSKVNEVFARTSKALDIKVNPRYGKWDNTQGTAVLAREAWLRTSGGAPEQA